METVQIGPNKCSSLRISQFADYLFPLFAIFGLLNVFDIRSDQGHGNLLSVTQKSEMYRRACQSASDCPEWLLGVGSGLFVLGAGIKHFVAFAKPGGKW